MLMPTDTASSIDQAGAYRLWKNFLKQRWPLYLVGIVTVIITNIMQVTVARGLGWVIDFFTQTPLPSWLTGRDSHGTFWRLFGLLAGAEFILFLGRIGWRFTLARQTHTAGAELKSKLWDRVRFFPQKVIEGDLTKGVLMNLSTSDVQSARFIFGFTLVGISDVLFLGLITLGAMMTIYLPMALLAFACLLFLPIFIRKHSQKEMGLYHHAQDSLSDFNDLVAQSVQTIRLQRVGYTGPFWLRRLLAQAQAYRQNRLKAAFVSLDYIPIVGSASIVSYLVLFIVGSYFVFKQKMSVGDFLAMQGLIFLLQDPLLELGYIISEWKKAMTSLGRLSALYGRDIESHLVSVGKSDERITPKTKSSHSVSQGLAILDAKNLGFTLPQGLELFQGLSFELFPGERLGIYGPVGSGKSTLLKILAGLEREHTGELLLNGKQFSEYSHKQLRQFMARVPQHPFLFADTIFQNVAMNQNLKEDEVWHYLELAGLADDVHRFPKHLHTPLGEWGINLSGGQKQRLTLARGLACNPELLFLDDCLSAVDTVTEEKILKSLDRHLKRTTLVWVAHRPSTLKYCDELIKLE